MDSNLRITGLLRDLASVQTVKHRKWAYKRAAAAVMNLPVPIESLRNSDGAFEKIAHVGPSSTRVIREVLDTGSSSTVDKAVAESGKAAQIEERRQWQHEFLSRAQVLAANDPDAGNAPAELMSLEACRADFQMHSEWSDGSASLEEMAAGCMERGYTHCVITDHSHGLRIARGMSMDDLHRQHAEIDELNRRHAPRFRIIKGIEANILADGSLDMSAEELDTLEFVVAAPHAVLRSPEDQTERMLAVVSHPHVRVLGHGRGRMFGSRPGISADWARVFDMAARRGVAIEIDGDPSRQDVDFTLARVALAAGCVIALSSDAHNPSQLRYIETAVAHARLAGVPGDRVINTWPLERLLEWAMGQWGNGMRR